MIRFQSINEIITFSFSIPILTLCSPASSQCFYRQPFCPFLLHPSILTHTEHSVMCRCRPTPPVTVPRGSVRPAPPTVRPAVTKHHPQNHLFTICQEIELVFFSFLSLLSKEVCGASCWATCFRNWLFESDK